MINLKALSLYKYTRFNAILNFWWQTADGPLLLHNTAQVNSTREQRLLDPSFILKNFFGFISIAIKLHLLFDDWKNADIGYGRAIYAAQFL